MRAPLMGIVAGTPCAGLVSAQEFTTLKGHGGPIMGLAVDGAGRVASASFDNSVGLWQGRVPRWLKRSAAGTEPLARCVVTNLLYPYDSVLLRFLVRLCTVSI